MALDTLIFVTGLNVYLVVRGADSKHMQCIKAEAAESAATRQ